MSDGIDFIKDSLFCEWGYVINLDDEVLEVYRGFQTEPHKNRYTDYVYESGGETYYPCKLIKFLPLNDIPNDIMKKLDRQSDVA
jgi:hypothetical protein